jgi:DNA-binding transcriptional LysR family regulator
MLRKIDWESQIGRRFKFRDLHVFITVAHHGNMSKAAVHLGVSQPAVSDAIADLEHAVGVRLFDRSGQGIEPTIYGRALLAGGLAAFDELKQSIKHIDFLKDSAFGEVRIGCSETIAAILSPVIEELSDRYPGMALCVSNVAATGLDLPQLRERSLDLALLRAAGPLSRDHLREHLHVEVLFDDELLIVTGRGSPWANRRKIDIADLAKERWILPPEGALNNMAVTEAFRACGLDAPRNILETFSVQLRANLLASGRYIAVFPRSMMRLYADRMSLKVLPLKLPAREWPVVLVMLKNRTVNPAVQLFLDHLRDFTRPMRARERTARKRTI